MYECIILFRNTRNNKVGYVSDGDGDLAVFANRDEAIETARDVPICRAYPYQIIELDEL